MHARVRACARVPVFELEHHAHDGVRGHRPHKGLTRGAVRLGIDVAVQPHKHLVQRHACAPSQLSLLQRRYSVLR